MRETSRSGRLHDTAVDMKLPLIASYVSDWVVLVAAAVVGSVLGSITPNKRPFDLLDRDISYPFTERETVSTTVLVLVSIVAPIVLVLLVVLVLVPGPTVPKDVPRSLVWRRKLWELHAGWLGLALSVVASWFITNGMKNLLGKPRPDLVSRCHLAGANVTDYLVGGDSTAPGFQQLVSAAICKNTDTATLDDGFRSFPSGHSSMSAAGLIYLSLFLASKLAIAVPFLAPVSDDEREVLRSSAFPSRAPHPTKLSSPSQQREQTAGDLTEGGDQVPDQGDAAQKAALGSRRQAAAPPLYLLVLASVPVFVSIFISMSRWYDFRHHGFDILFGFAIGSVTSLFAFRYYHMPVRSGAGWAWGARSTDKAFWAGLGSNSYATSKTSPV